MLKPFLKNERILSINKIIREMRMEKNRIEGDKKFNSYSLADKIRN